LFYIISFGDFRTDVIRFIQCLANWPYWIGF